MRQKNIKRRLMEIGMPVLFFICFLIVWELLVIFLRFPEYLLPQPSKILNEIFANSGRFLMHTGITMFEAVMGYLIANISGFLVAVVFAHNRTIEKGFYPYAIALKTTPIIAMAPLLILWFGTGIASKIVASAIVCFFPILVNTVRGLRAVDEGSLDLFRSYYASRWQIFTKLSLPTALPYVFSALKISTGLAVVGAIVGEFVGANKGIGYVILVSTYHLETVTMFAGIIMSALIGVLFFWAVSLIEKKVVFWQESESGF